MIWEYIWQQKTKIINNKKVFAEGGGGGGGGGGRGAQVKNSRQIWGGRF